MTNNYHQDIVDKILNITSDFICTLNTDNEFVQISPSLTEVLGYSKSELIGQKYLVVVFPDDRQQTSYSLANSGAKNEKFSFSNRIICKNGPPIQFSWSAEWSEESQVLVCLAKNKPHPETNVTKLQNREEKYHSLIENSLHSFLLTKPDSGEILKANSTSVEMFGYSLEELKKMHRHDILDHQEPAFISILKERQETGKVVGEATGIRKNGTRFPCEFSSVLFTDKDGESRSSILITDITARKSAERRLEQNEKRFRSLIEYVDDIILLVDKAGKLTYVSPAFERITGFKQSEVIGKSGTDFGEAIPEEDRSLFIQELLNNPGIPIPRTNKLVHKNKHIIQVEGTVVNLLHDESVQAVVSIYKDITARIEAEEKIKESEANLRAIFNNAIEGFVLLDINGIIQALNSKAKEYIEYNGQEGQIEIGKSILEFIEPEWKENFAGLFKRVLKGEIIAYDKDYIRADGNKYWLHFIINPVYTSDKITGICITGTDITPRKQTEELVKANEKRYRALIENGADAVVIFNEEFKIIYASSSIRRVLGYSEEEIKQIDIQTLILPEEIEELQKVITQVFQSPGVPVSGRTGKMRHKDGSWRWIEATVTNLLHDPAINGIVDNFRDVTEKVEADIALEQSRRHLQKIMDATLDVICMFDAEGRFLQVNQASKQAWGYEPAELLGRSYHDFIHPDDIAITNEVSSLILSGIPTHNFENRFVRKDGSIMSLVWSSRWDIEEKAMFSIARDATEKKRAEELVLNSEKRFRALIENRFDGVAILSAEGIPVYASPAIFNILGYTEAEILQIQITSLLHPEGFDKLQQMNAEIIANPGIPIGGYIFKMLHKNGSWRWIEITATNLFHEPAIRGVVDNFRDVTDKIEAERLREFERLDKEALINSTQDLIWSVNKNFKLIAANRAFLKSLKISTGKDLVPGDDLFLTEIFNPDMLSFWEEMYKKALIGEPFKKEVYTHELRDTEYAWSEISFNPIFNGLEIVGIACHGRNITETKRIQNQITEINKKLETAQHIAKLGYWQIDLETESIFWSDEMYHIWGVSKAVDIPSFELLTQIVHLDDREAFLEDLNGVREFKENNEFKHRIVLPDGSVKYVLKKGETVVNEAGIPIRIEGTVQDITERELAQQAIIKSNERFEYATKATSDAIWDWDLKTDDLIWGDGFNTLFGYDISTIEINIESWHRHIHPIDKERILKSVRRIIDDPTQTYWQDEYRYQKADGTFAFVVDRGLVIRQKYGEPTRMIGAMQDITERKTYEGALRYSKEQLQHSLNELSQQKYAMDQHSIIAVTDVEGTIIYVNDKFCTLSQYSRKELIGNNHRLINSGIHPKSFFTDMFRDISRGKVWHGEICNRAKDGSMYWVDTTIVPLLDYNTGKPVQHISIRTDITKIKNNEIDLQLLNEQITRRAEDIEEQNAKLREIAWMQSHVIRAPLARIMGLTNLFDKEVSEMNKKQIISYIQTSAVELDKVIRGIVKKTERL